MSYDLMVFEKSKAPRSADEFMKWYESQTEWTESHGYEDPAVSSPALQRFFHLIKEYFPPMNGAYAPDAGLISEDETLEERLCDYCIGQDVIYMSFGWSQVERAYDLVKRAAWFSGAGFFEANGGDTPLFFEEDTPMLLEGQWFRPMAAREFSSVREKIESMTAKNRSFLCLSDISDSYIQAGGFCGAFTVEVRKYVSPGEFLHQKAGYIPKTCGSNQEMKMGEVQIGGNPVRVRSSQILSFETVIKLFEDFFNGNETTEGIVWEKMEF